MAAATSSTWTAEPVRTAPPLTVVEQAASDLLNATHRLRRADRDLQDAQAAVEACQREVDSAAPAVERAYARLAELHK